MCCYFIFLPQHSRFFLPGCFLSFSIILCLSSSCTISCSLKYTCNGWSKNLGVRLIMNIDLLLFKFLGGISLLILIILFGHLQLELFHHSIDPHSLLVLLVELFHLQSFSEQKRRWRGQGSQKVVISIYPY